MVLLSFEKCSKLFKRSDFMELLQLRYFYESAKNENFSKTAELFMVPTTSVSAAIKRLEKELDCKLFDRTANRIYLNTNGHLLQQALCSVFRELDNVVEELSVPKEDSREIKILVRGMRRKITDLITEYSRKHAHVAFKTVFNYDETDYQAYDIIIDDEKDCYADYERIELFSMRLRLKCSTSSKLCKQKLLLNQLCDEPFISMGTEGNMHRILTKACNRVGFTPNVSVLCNDIECYEKFIAAGMGIAREEEGNSDISPSLCSLNVTDFNEHYTVYAYYSKKEYYGNIKSFVDFLRSKNI